MAALSIVRKVSHSLLKRSSYREHSWSPCPPVRTVIWPRSWWSTCCNWRQCALPSTSFIRHEPGSCTHARTQTVQTAMCVVSQLTYQSDSNAQTRFSAPHTGIFRVAEVGSFRSIFCGKVGHGGKSVNCRS